MLRGEEEGEKEEEEEGGWRLREGKVRAKYHAHLPLFPDLAGLTST